MGCVWKLLWRRRNNMRSTTSLMLLMLEWVSERNVRPFGGWHEDSCLFAILDRFKATRTSSEGGRQKKKTIPEDCCESSNRQLESPINALYGMTSLLCIRRRKKKANSTDAVPCLQPIAWPQDIRLAWSTWELLLDGLLLLSFGNIWRRHHVTNGLPLELLHIFTQMLLKKWTSDTLLMFTGYIVIKSHRSLLPSSLYDWRLGRYYPGAGKTAARGCNFSESTRVEK